MLVAERRLELTAPEAQRARRMWIGTVALIAGVFIARMVYLIWLSPYELVGDEAYYWEWSRHLDLCYDEKGPALGWFIAGCTKLFGDHEWTVRLPVALSAAVAAWILARVAVSISGGDERAGFWAVVCLCVLPAFHANAQLCTQDGPVIAIWIALTAVGLRIVRHWREGGTRMSDWALFAALLGLGFLFKQSILLVGASLGLFAIVARRELVWRRGLFVQWIVAAAVFAIFVSPMVIWNARHGWPTLAHTAGHLFGGGDQAETVKPRWTPAWMLTFVGAQIGMLGPGFVLVAALACVAVMRLCKSGDERAIERLWIVFAAGPSVVFFFLLSFIKPVIASWPVPSFIPLLALVGAMAAEELPRRAEMVAAWRKWKANGVRGIARRKPGTWFTVGWDVMLVYGLTGCVLFSFPTMLLHVPVLGETLNRPMARLSGNAAHAREVERIVQSIETAEGKRPVIVARYYMTAALDAFYMPGKPNVYCAGTAVGKRPTAYDFWPVTDLRDPKLLGRTMLLDGGGDTPWDRALLFDEVKPLVEKGFYLGRNFRGIRGPG
jgi:undecaprenyl-diphosphatase